MLKLEELKKIISYNPETGQILKFGQPTGSIEGGALRLCINSKRVYAHTLIWYLMTAELFDKDQIGFKDGDKLNLRWNNLYKLVEHKQQPTQDQLKELLHYDPETGILTWLVSYRTYKAGMQAGGINKERYLTVCIAQIPYKVHILAYFYMTGEWPDRDIDHINRIRDDNRWENLRLATGGQNRANSPKMRTNTAGYKYVYRTKTGKYGASLKHKNIKYYLGVFDTPEAAAIVAQNKAIELLGEFAYIDPRLV